MNVQQVPIQRIIADPHNPRRDFNSAKRAELAASIQQHGIQVPLLGYAAGDKYMLGDGHCRWEAALELLFTELPMIVFPQRPSEQDLLLTQLTINGHRHALSAVDEWQAFTRLCQLNNWSPSQLATALAISNAAVTRTLAIGKLTPDERQRVSESKISKSAAYALARLPPEQRTACLEQAAAGELTRDALNARARKPKPTDRVVGRRISCQTPRANISVQGNETFDLVGLIDLFEFAAKELKKAHAQKLDLRTALLVLRDRSVPRIANS